MTQATTYVRGFGSTADAAIEDLKRNFAKPEWAGWTAEGAISVDDHELPYRTATEKFYTYEASQFVFRDVSDADQ